MFTQRWRDHWGLQNDPFACEDADKDLILSEIGMDAVHSGFDRVFGDPRAPSPGIVFGEKGSGKSGLRLMMRRRIEAHNAAHPDARVFVVEYIDFNGLIEAVGRSDGKRGRIDWHISDHLDGILSLGVTGLVDRLLDGDQDARGLGRKQTVDLMLLTALVYRGGKRTPGQALSELARQLSFSLAPRARGRFVGALILGLLIALLPHLATAIEALAALAFLADHTLACYGAGLGLMLAAGLASTVAKSRTAARARSARRSVRILPPDASSLAGVLNALDKSERTDAVLPDGADEGSRYELLGRFLGLLQALRFDGLYVLMDRVDEPTLLADDNAAMQDFVSTILDIKLLQHPRLALKLFLPIEMESIWRNASSEQLKRMRLDKSNLLPELKWTGRELYEIANRRLLASRLEAPRVQQLADLFADDLSMDHVLETFSALGTPRYAFGFLSEVFLQYVKDLPDDLTDDDPRWSMPKAAFDVVRAAWIDRAGVLRRTLN